jgi:putative transcriptional regulator
VTASLRGKLLVATPKLLDPNFVRTVVLLCFHDENGAFGLVLNRPVETAPLREHLPEWTEAAADPAFVFSGGPVEPSHAFGLARLRPTAEAPSEGWTEIIDGVGIVDLSRPGALLPLLQAVRVYAGYSGWAGGQLEGELAEGAWFVVDPRAEDIFTPEPAILWRTVLRRQRGQLAMFAWAPMDPRLN